MYHTYQFFYLIQFKHFFRDLNDRSWPAYFIRASVTDELGKNRQISWQEWFVLSDEDNVRQQTAYVKSTQIDLIVVSGKIF
jgi:hypothetical protein